MNVIVFFFYEINLKSEIKKCFQETHFKNVSNFKSITRVTSKYILMYSNLPHEEKPINLN